jgi:hypothetical protein
MGSLTGWFPFYDCLEEADGFLVGPWVVEDVFVGFAGGLRGGRWGLVLLICCGG